MTSSCFGNWMGKNKDHKRVKPCPNKVDEPIQHLDNLSLGVEFAGRKMNVIIPSNTIIPIQKEIKFTTTKDYQTSVTLRVYEGESSLTYDNVQIGKFVLDAIPPAPKSVPKLRLYFDIDVNGTLRVSAKDIIASELKEITITSEKRQSAKMLYAKNTLHIYAEDILKTVNDTKYAEILKAVEKQKVIDAANESIRWLYMNPSAKVNQYKDEQKHLEDLWNPIITKLYKDAVPSKVENKSASQEPEFGSVNPKTDSKKSEFGSVTHKTDSQKPESGNATPKTAFNLNEVD